MLNIKLADKEYIKNLTKKDMDDSAIKFVQDNYGASYGEAKEAVKEIREMPTDIIVETKRARDSFKLPALIGGGIVGAFILVAVLFSLADGGSSAKTTFAPQTNLNYETLVSKRGEPLFHGYLYELKTTVASADSNNVYAWQIFKQIALLPADYRYYNYAMWVEGAVFLDQDGNCIEDSSIYPLLLAHYLSRTA